MNDEKIKDYLEKARTIAIIGFSKYHYKTAYKIPKYLTKYYHVIPVNPTIDEIDGLTCYKSITDVPEQVDIVDVFRPGPQCSEIMKDIISLPHKPKLVWLQLRITNAEAKKLAEEHDIDIVEDACIMLERERLLN